MTVIELELVQEHKKIWAVFGNNEYMPLGKLQMHAACLGWSQHSGNTLKIEKILIKNSGIFCVHYFQKCIWFLDYVAMYLWPHFNFVLAV